ncbi:MAG: hypothetical protein NW703_13235 [Nitrospiraceae bacterium]
MVDDEGQPDSESRPTTVPNQIDIGELVLQEGPRTCPDVQDHVFRRWVGAQNTVRREEADSLVYLLLTSPNGFPARLIYIPTSNEPPRRVKRSGR